MRSLTRWYSLPFAPTGEPGRMRSVVAEQVVQTLSRGRSGSCGHSTTTERRERHRQSHPDVPRVTNPPCRAGAVRDTTPDDTVRARSWCDPSPEPDRSETEASARAHPSIPLRCRATALLCCG